MDENHNNNNSIVVQQKQDLFPLKGLKISSSEEVPDDVELLKDGNKEATKINFESTQQARQLKEAGSSTLSANVATKDVNTSTLKGCPGDDTSNFKPANETQDDGDTRGNTTGEAREGSSDEGDTHNFSKNATLDKTLSYDEGATLIRERFLKNSTKAQSQNFQNGKSVEITLDHPKSEGNPAIGDSSSGKSLTNSTRKEEKTRRNRVKPNYSLEMAKTSHAKKRFEESPKSPEEAPPAPPRQISKSKAKEICLNWIKSLIALEAKTNMEDDKELPDAEVSEYCSNKMCPISINKIQKTPKIMKQLKRVRMRKVHLENEYMNEDRWYCLKCLQSHEQSLSCLYCSQVYFIEEEVLEDEEKVWICCDKCDRWIHLECEIQTGKNSKLRHQDYDSESFRYSCPECKPSSTKKKTTKKEQRKAAKKGVKTKPEAAKKGRRNTGNSEVSGSVNDGEKAPKIPLRASVSQRRRSDLNSSSYSNSLDDVSQKDKNVVFESDAKMADESSEINNYVREDSQMCSNEESKRRSTELSSKNHSRETKENRRSNRTRKVKESKASKENMAKNRKNLKRNHEEYSQQDYSNERESVQELTLYRSLKIAREREDIVEARTLAPKVLQFCGLSPAQVAERVEKDLEIIMQHLAEDMKNDENLRDSFMGEFSQRDIYFNNPEKDTERGAYCTNSSMNLASSSFGGATNANEHGKSLRSRRTRTATSKNY